MQNLNGTLILFIFSIKKEKRKKRRKLNVISKATKEKNILKPNNS